MNGIKSFYKYIVSPIKSGKSKDFNDYRISVP